MGYILCWGNVINFVFKMEKVIPVEDIVENAVNMVGMYGGPIVLYNGDVNEFREISDSLIRAFEKLGKNICLLNVSDYEKGFFESVGSGSSNCVYVVCDESSVLIKKKPLINGFYWINVSACKGHYSSYASSITFLNSSAFFFPIFSIFCNFSSFAFIIFFTVLNFFRSDFANVGPMFGSDWIMNSCCSLRVKGLSFTNWNSGFCSCSLFAIV